jgi:lipopolysaccharide transport system permease protein
MHSWSAPDARRQAALAKRAAHQIPGAGHRLPYVRNIERGMPILLAESLVEPWRFRELLLFLAWREVQVRYKQAFLGAAWAVIQPLFTMLTFTFFFGHLAGISSNGLPYPVFSYAALVLWMYVSTTLAQAGNSLVSNSNLITKVYFPRVFLPAAAALSNVLDLLIGSTVLVAMLIYYGVRPGLLVLLTPLFVIETILLTLGISMLLAAVNVRYRDIKYTIPFITQLWLFITPIIYPVSFVPARFRGLLALNPMAGIVEGFRACLMPGGSVDWALVGSSWLVTLALLIVATWYFRSTEREFADIV